MKCARYTGSLLEVNGGPPKGGWWVTSGFNNREGPWRRYYPPGYSERLAMAGTAFGLARLVAGGEWFVENLTDGGMTGPFPTRDSAHAAWRLLST